MSGKIVKDRWAFEVMLIVLVLGITVLLHRMGVNKIVTLNLFYLPVVLSGYYLGRHSAGILAFFSALCVTIVMALDPVGLAAYATPVMMGLVVTVWAAVLGLTAILVGTLCDERAAVVEDLHEAYVGVVEVVSKYLQGAESKVKTRSSRVAELSEEVAREMNLSPKLIDDIRVSVFLHDVGNVEVTTRVLGKAIGALGADRAGKNKYTFLGTDLVHSLGTVLTDAAPLILNQDDTVRDYLVTEDRSKFLKIPLGARIIRAVRQYDALTAGGSDGARLTPAQALSRLRQETGAHESEVLNALERVVCRACPESAVELVFR